MCFHCFQNMPVKMRFSWTIFLRWCAPSEVKSPKLIWWTGWAKWSSSVMWLLHLYLSINNGSHTVYRIKPRSPGRLVLSSWRSISLLQHAGRLRGALRRYQSLRCVQCFHLRATNIPIMHASQVAFDQGSKRAYISCFCVHTIGNNGWILFASTVANLFFLEVILLLWALWKSL